jgi:predicted nucleotidyltransferase
VGQLGDMRTAVVERLRELARDLDPQPVSLIAFGSFARGTADSSSDIDLLAIRSAIVDADAWDAITLAGIGLGELMRSDHDARRQTT